MAFQNEPISIAACRLSKVFSSDGSITASRFVRGSATGLGDVDARVKLNLRRGDPVAVGVLADVRFPTGSESDLLGSGAWAARGLAIVEAVRSIGLEVRVAETRFAGSAAVGDFGVRSAQQPHTPVISASGG